MKPFGMYFAGAMAIALIFAVNWYIAGRIVGCVRLLLPKVSHWLRAGLCLVMLVVLLGGFFRSMLPLPEGVKHVLGVLNACWMGIFVYLLIYLLASDVLVGLGRLIRLVQRQDVAAVRAWAGMAAVLLALGTAAYGFAHVNSIQKPEYTIALDDAAGNKMNIVLITDLHLGAVGSEARLEEIVTQINERKPDLVCIAGDFFDSDFGAIRNPEQAAEHLRRLSAKYGVYACLGNHDAGGTFEKMTAFLDSCGIRLLEDEAVTIDDRLMLVGRLDGSPIGGFSGQSRAPLSQILPATELPVVVMDHNPAHVDSYGSETDLVLCGHTHRGQIFPGSLITDAMYTVDYGYYRRDEQSPHVIVSSGVGYWGMPMRVGTDCEIVTIQLTF